MIEIQSGATGHYRPLAFDNTPVVPQASTPGSVVPPDAGTATVDQANDHTDLAALDAVALAFVTDVRGEPEALREPLKTLLQVTLAEADASSAARGEQSCTSVIKTISGMPLENLLAFEGKLARHAGTVNLGESVRLIRDRIDASSITPAQLDASALDRLANTIAETLSAAMARGWQGVPDSANAGKVVLNVSATVGISIVVRKVLGIAVKEAYHFTAASQSTRVAMAFVPMVIVLGLMARDAQAHFADTGRRSDRSQVSRAILSALVLAAPAALAMAGRWGAVGEASPSLIKTLLYVFTRDALQTVLPGDAVSARLSMGGLAVQTGIFIGVETLLGRSDNALAQRTLLTRSADVIESTWLQELGAEVSNQAPSIAWAVLFNVGAEVMDKFARPVLMKMLDFTLPPAHAQAGWAGRTADPGQLNELSQWESFKSQLTVGATLSVLAIGYMAAVEALAEHLCPDDEDQRQSLQETLQAIGLGIMFPLANFAGESIYERADALTARASGAVSPHAMV